MIRIYETLDIIFKTLAPLSRMKFEYVDAPLLSLEISPDIDCGHVLSDLLSSVVTCLTVDSLVSSVSIKGKMIVCHMVVIFS